MEKLKKEKYKVGQSVNLEIDVEKEIIQKLITLLHIYYMSLYEELLENMLLKRVISFTRKIRFDFSHNKPIEEDEMIKINQK